MYNAAPFKRSLCKFGLPDEIVPCPAQVHLVVGPNVHDEVIFGPWTKLHHVSRINHTLDGYEGLRDVGHLKFCLPNSPVTALRL